jgi:FMN-dependent NADH-azoreductase
MSVLFIDACVRENSRTRELALGVLDGIGGERESVELWETPAAPLDRASLEKRTKLAASGRFDDPIFQNARRFAAADEIVVAAPYWDLSFPAVLKAYFESVCVIGVTFDYDESGKPFGLCRAKRLVYVTTAGGVNVPLDFGYGYVKALCERFFGIEEVSLVKAEGLDI